TPLILVGGKGWLYDEIFARITQLGLQKRVRFTGYVADADLPLWYNAATLLAFPSVYEGFGLPVVEAMACGTPVVASQVSSIPEAAGDAGMLFDPHDKHQLAQAITAVLSNPDLAATMREQGRQQASRFSWERAGQETAVVYQRALRNV
ncbi:MAG: glycosyltransferase family 4 protein, partial [Ardenticatenaceae bacterium]|nr:glycosyltransferase family 4 protein [Ardenticatenaceae bacterium]